MILENNFNNIEICLIKVKSELRNKCSIILVASFFALLVESVLKKNLFVNIKDDYDVLKSKLSRKPNIQNKPNIRK